MGYTTIQINNNLKEKLNKLKEETGRNRYDEVIDDILNGGRVIDDVLTIQREQTAFTLNYWDNKQSLKKDVTYNDLKKSSIGQQFIIHTGEKPNNDWFNSSAEVICKFNNDNDVLLLMREESLINNEYNHVEHVLHVKTY